MSAAFTRVIQQNQLAIKEGVNFVKNIINTTPASAGFTTHELYKLALKEPPPPDYQPPAQRTSPSLSKLVNRGGKNNISVEMPQPPHPEHPVRSMSFLKRSILPILEGQRLLKKTRAQRIPAHAAAKKGKQAQDAPEAAPATETVWVWQPIDPSTLPPRPVPEPPKEVYGADVGVGEDLGHLSRRRERARRAKIRADVHAMKVAEGIARHRERAAAGAALREKQAQQAARRQKPEEEMARPLKAGERSAPQDAGRKDRLNANAALLAKRKVADATLRSVRKDNNPQATPL